MAAKCQVRLLVLQFLILFAKSFWSRSYSGTSRFLKQILHTTCFCFSVEKVLLWSCDTWVFSVLSQQSVTIREKKTDISLSSHWTKCHFQCSSHCESQLSDFKLPIFHLPQKLTYSFQFFLHRHFWPKFFSHLFSCAPLHSKPHFLRWGKDNRV